MVTPGVNVSSVKTTAGAATVALTVALSGVLPISAPMREHLERRRLIGPHAILAENLHCAGEGHKEDCMRGMIPTVVLFSALLTLAAAAQDSRVVFGTQTLPLEREAVLQAFAPPPGPHILRRRYATVNVAAIQSMQPFVLNLFDDVSITVDGSKLRHRGDTYELVDFLPARQWGAVTIGMAGTMVRATVYLDEKVYEIASVGDDVVVIDEVDPSKLPPIDPPITRPRPGDSAAAPTAEAPALAEIPNLKVLALLPISSPAFCTPHVLAAIASQYQANLNLSFVFNHQQMATATFTAVCVQHDPVGGSLDEDLNWVTHDPTVARLRSENRADLVTFIVPSSSTFCGKAWLNLDVARAKAWGFSVVVGSCATSTFTLAHEIGHNLGMRHDRATEHAFEDPACNFGLCTTKGMATIMAYPSACPGSTRFGVFSTPRKQAIGPVEVGPYGFPCDFPPYMGMYVRSDNQRTLLHAAPIVANWF